MWGARRHNRAFGSARFTLKSDLKEWQEVVCHVDDTWKGTIDQIVIRFPFSTPRGDIWLLHYDGHLTTNDGSFLIESGDARLLVRMVEPERFVFSIEQGFRATHEDFTRGLNPEETRAALQRADYLKVCPVDGQTIRAPDAPLS